MPSRALVAAAGALHDDAGLADDLFAALEAELTTEQLLELVVLASWYRLISAVIDVARVEAEPWAACW